MRGHAPRIRDVQRSRNSQGINASVKPDEAARKTLLDQQGYPLPRNPPPPVFPRSEELPKVQPDQGRDSRSQVDDATPVGGPPAGRTPDEGQAAPVARETGPTVGGASVDRSTDDAIGNTLPPVLERDGAPPSEALPNTAQERHSRPQGNDATRASGPSVDRAPDDVQAAPVEREAAPTVGAAPVNASTNAVENIRSPVVERNGMSMARSLDGLTVVMVTIVGALALIKFLFRRTYRKRVLAFGAMRRSQPPANGVRPLDLSRRPRQRVETDPGPASSLDSVKKALDEIDEALVEMTSSRQLRTPL